MKKLSLTAIIAFVSIITIYAQNSFTITGDIAGLGNETVFITYFDGAKNAKFETVAVNGKFTLEGEAPQMTSVVRFDSSFDRKTYLGDNKSSMFMPAIPLELILTKGAKLHITGKAEELNLAIVEGDSYNEGMNKLKAIDKPFLVEMKELQGYLTQARKMGLKEDSEEIAKKMLENRTNHSIARKQFIKDNPKEFASVWVLSVISKDLKSEELKSFYDQLSKENKKTVYAESIAARINVLTATESGKAAPTFSKPGLNGEIINLTDMKGKYVLLDFWGSWCAPCRSSNPHLKQLYSQYKEKGFEILGIACEKSSSYETALTTWKNAVKKDELTWVQVINNEENMKVDVAQLYGEIGRAHV